MVCKKSTRGSEEENERGKKYDIGLKVSTAVVLFASKKIEVRIRARVRVSVRGEEQENFASIQASTGSFGR